MNIPSAHAKRTRLALRTLWSAISQGLAGLWSASPWSPFVKLRAFSGAFQRKREKAISPFALWFLPRLPPPPPKRVALPVEGLKLTKIYIQNTGICENLSETLKLYSEVNKLNLFELNLLLNNFYFAGDEFMMEKYHRKVYINNNKVILTSACHSPHFVERGGSHARGPSPGNVEPAVRPARPGPLQQKGSDVPPQELGSVAIPELFPKEGTELVPDVLRNMNPVPPVSRDHLPPADWKGSDCSHRGIRQIRPNPRCAVHPFNQLTYEQ